MCNLRIKAETDSFSTKEYGTYGWPITYFDSAQNLNEKDNCATINLRIDDNTKPILFFENTKLLGKNNHSRFWDEKQLLNGTATDWSNDITLRFPNTGSDKNNVAYYIKLQYFRQEYNPLSPNTVLKNEQYFDSAFCPIDLLNTSNDNNVFQQVHNPSMHYVRGRMLNYTKEFGYFAQNGAYWDKDRVLFYSQIIFPHKTTGHFYSKEKGIDNKFSLESNFFNISFLKKDVNISCSILQEKKGVNQYEPFKIISVSHYNGLFGAKENLLLLGLTEEELQSLKDAANAIDQYTHSPRLSDLYRQYVFLEEIPSSPETDKDGILFRKFMLKIQGYTPEGVVSFVETNKKIYVYSRDGLCFTSIGFAEREKEIKQITFKIYSNGHIDKYIPEKGAKSAEYFYIESSGKKHFLGQVNFETQIWRNTAGAEKKRGLNNEILPNCELTRYSNLTSYSSGNVKFKISPGSLDSGRFFIDIDAFACLIGALIEESIEDLRFNGFSIEDGNTAGGSSSHVNGMIGDVGYLNRNRKPCRTLITKANTENGEDQIINPDYDYERQVKFCNALYKFGFSRYNSRKMLTENVYELKDGKMEIRNLPHCQHYVRPGVRHYHHLHIQGLKLSDIMTIKSY